jgi:Cu/Ag efflux pump CusA
MFLMNARTTIIVVLSLPVTLLLSISWHLDDWQLLFESLLMMQLSIWKISIGG